VLACCNRAGAGARRKSAGCIAGSSNKNALGEEEVSQNSRFAPLLCIGGTICFGLGTEVFRRVLRHSFCSSRRYGMRTSLEVHPRVHRLSCEGWCHTVPSPLVGEGQGEGWRRTPSVRFLRLQTRKDSWLNFLERRLKQKQCVFYPSPCPSPTRGEGTLWHGSAQPLRGSSDMAELRRRIGHHPPRLL
jgi:hypothetical protein